MSFRDKKYKIIQYATGNQGKFAIRTIAERPHLALTGVWVSNPDKIGRDAGEIAGIKSLGVKAVGDLDILLQTDADCVIYSPLYPELDVMTKILASGKNLITQLGYVYVKEPAILGALNKACEEGNSTFHATGINPGMFGDRLTVAITTLSQTIEKITLVEHHRGNMTGLSDEMVFGQMGFGWTQAQLDEKRPPLLDGINDRAFREAADYVATAFGYTVDKFTSSHDFILAKHPFHSSGRTIEVGQVAAIRNIYRASFNGQERFNLINAWVLDASMDTGWGYSDEFYQILIEGSPPSKLTWHPETESPMESALIATAMAAVNAIPYICDASAGVKTTLDLPNMGFTGPFV